VGALLTAENINIMNSAKSLRTRAVMALFLMLGFYGFALAVAGGLLWVPR
jgi:hypothetical protein